LIAIGIDPGLTGAIAFIGPNSCAVEDLPTSELPGNGLVRRKINGVALAHLIRRHVPADQKTVVFCEAIGNVGGKDNRTMAQGALLRALGAIETVCEILRMPPEMVYPQTWKRFYGLDADKRKGLERARLLYPAAPLKLAKHHNRAEAVLIAHYARSLKA